MDDTIENLCEVWVNWLDERYKTGVCYTDIDDWDISKSFPTLKKSQVLAPLSSIELWGRVKPLDGAQYYLQKLIYDGHDVIIVTASPCSEVVLLKHFPFISHNNVIITSRKQLVIGDILIDDAPHNLEGGTYKGILMDACHNRKYDNEKHGIVRVHNWEEIYNLILNMQEEEKFA